MKFRYYFSIEYLDGGWVLEDGVWILRTEVKVMEYDDGNND